MVTNLNKIIYFDRETINNLLEQFNKGEKKEIKGTSSSLKTDSEVSVEANIKLSIPFFNRLSFLFSSKLSASYLIQKDKSVTITSTEISDFDNLKKKLTCITDVQVKDIENSSTFFRVAGEYSKMLKGGVDDVDIKEYSTVMNNYEGYDTYKIDEGRYIRFNNTAFISNYKRNDLLTTNIDIYCMPIGIFKYEEFNFLEQINKMSDLVTGVEQNKSLADLYPPEDMDDDKKNQDVSKDSNTSKYIELFDVLYASVSRGT